MFEHQSNYNYFHFITPNIAEFEQVNTTFQATDEDPGKWRRSLICIAKVFTKEFMTMKENLPIERTNLVAFRN